ncbi:ATP-binding protein [candidate division KSB1 bacterium]|nr:ATP-binding protein [candidate division KSB1 bacterium]
MKEEIVQLRPSFLNDLNRLYRQRKKNVILMTGNIHDSFWDTTTNEFAPMDQVLYSALREHFTIVFVDMAGISFLSAEDELDFARVWKSAEHLLPAEGFREQELEEFRNAVANNTFQSLAALVMLKHLTERMVRFRKKHAELKPLAIIVRLAGTLFPEGEINRLPELDKNRLAFFYAWLTQPEFREEKDFFILLNRTNSEVNSLLRALPHTASISIPLPDEEQRRQFVEHFLKNPKFGEALQLEGGKERFIADSAGLTLEVLKDLFEDAVSEKKPVTRAMLLAEINNLLREHLGDIIEVEIPTFGPEAVIGNEEHKQILDDVFERCEHRDTAVSAILISGPNGGGKTFLLQAYAGKSGRVVIRIKNLRSMYYGQTSVMFELFRWYVLTFGKILILVDEAHTAFGSVHSPTTHEAEKQLAGNIIQMMGDERNLVKVLWGLMTSRPDELDPDVKSRSPIQIAVFDPEGEKRVAFIRELFKRKGVPLDELSPADWDTLISKTTNFSARDFRNLTAEMLHARRKHPQISVLQVLDYWRAGMAIVREREFQMHVAAMHCSYPALLPERFRKMGTEELITATDDLKLLMQLKRGG